MIFIRVYSAGCVALGDFAKGQAKPAILGILEIGGFDTCTCVLVQV